jgi:GTPase
MSTLSQGVLKGDRVAISKALSSIESRDQESLKLLKEIYPWTGHAFVVGLTGPPGTGKSTLVDQLVKLYRGRGVKVAVLAVDPSSPVSGGALLGDRVRMITHTLDAGVYIRSMASRGDEGGLSRAARNAVRVLDAAGYDIILVETVGIGQAEVEIFKVADVVVVVLMPELGDEVQAAKAGLLEIGDIFVVNKADLPGADMVMYNLGTVLSSRRGWRQVALKVSAKSGEGLPSLVESLDQFRSHYEKSSALKEKKLADLSDELARNISLSISETVEKFKEDPQFRELVRKVAKKRLDPESATRVLLDRINLSSSSSKRKSR